MTLIGSLSITENDYFDILRRKTAYLFSACCEIGAILGGASLEVQNAMRDYGLNLGIAFQLADDILDLTSDDASLGKAAGVDLLEGKLTLPLIKLVQSDPSMKAVFEKVMFDGDYSSFPRESIMDRLRNDGTIDSITDEANNFARLARKSLDVLPETEYRSALEEIPEFVIQRKA